MERLKGMHFHQTKENTYIWSHLNWEFAAASMAVNFLQLEYFQPMRNNNLWNFQDENGAILTWKSFSIMAACILYIGEF